MSFESDLLRFQKKIEQKAVRVVNTVVFEVAENLISLSPWGDWDFWSPTSQRRKPRPPYWPGTFRGGWRYGRGVVPGGADFGADPTGASLFRQVSSGRGGNVKSVAVVHYVVNDLEYAKQMERAYGLVGWNTQLGHMVEVTAQNFEKIVDQAVKNVGG